MENDVMTVQKLKEQLDKVCSHGYGDIPIRLRDDVLHDDGNDSLWIFWFSAGCGG